jgi:hypothetical protein
MLTDTPVTVTVADADFDGSATLVAFTEYVPPVTGAVNVALVPLPATVPPVADQLTAVLSVFVTEAVNCRVPAAPTVADPGVTDTTISGGGGSLDEPQAAMATVAESTRIGCFTSTSPERMGLRYPFR